jgi:hypothetical protein
MTGSGDLRAVSGLRRLTIRNYALAVSAFCRYLTDRAYGWAQRTAASLSCATPLPTTTPARIRAVARLMLLYAQPLSRVLRLVVTDITQGDDGQVHICVGHRLPRSPNPSPASSASSWPIGPPPAATG